MKLSMLLIAIVILTSACVGGQNVGQDGDSAAQEKNLVNANVLSSCGKIESNSVLESDINATYLKALEACFEVTQDNIVLDCKDHYITGWVQRAEGTGTKGLVGNGVVGLKIRNCVFKSHFMGIDLKGEDVEVTDSKFEVNSIGLNGQYTNSVFRANEFHNSSNTGLWLEKSKNNRIENSVFMKNAKSLILKDSSNNVAFDNQMDGEISKTAGSTGYGIWLLRSDDNTVDSNRITKYYNGMLMQGSSRNTIVKNTLKSNLHMGLYIISDRDLHSKFSELINSADNTIRENTIEGSIVAGVHIENLVEAKNILLSNNLCGNQQYDLNCRANVTLEGSGNKLAKVYKAPACTIVESFSESC